MADEATSDSGFEKPRAMFELVETTIGEVSDVLPVNSGAMRLAFTLRTASATVFHDLHERLASVGGLASRSLNLVLLLAAKGDLEQSELSRLTGLSKATVSGLVEQLVQDGLVERRARAGDRRVVILALTPAGLERFVHGFSIFHDGELAWATTLTLTEQETLVDLLRKIVTNGPGAPALP